MLSEGLACRRAQVLWRKRGARARRFWSRGRGGRGRRGRGSRREVVECLRRQRLMLARSGWVVLAGSVFGS